MPDYPDYIFENLRPGEAPQRRRRSAPDPAAKWPRTATLRKREKRHLTKPFPVTTLGKALKQALNIPAIRRRMNAAEISASWEDLVGEVMAQHVQPVSLEKGVLTLKTDSSVWRQQISLSKEWICKRIQEKFDAEIVRTLRIK